MNATQLFIGLVGLLVMLFAMSLLKPYVFNKQSVSIQGFRDELSKLLPAHDFIIKQGAQSRIIISQHGIQKAIIIIDKPKAKYVMGNLPIFTTNKIKRLQSIADKIKGLEMMS